MLRRWALGLLAATITLAGLSSCGSERRSAAMIGPFVPNTAAETNGRRVFLEFCHQCHPNGESGLGPAVNDKPVPDVAIRAQVREGLGAMPAFGEREIPARDLDDLLAYMTALRDHGD